MAEARAPADGADGDAQDGGHVASCDIVHRHIPVCGGAQEGRVRAAHDAGFVGLVEALGQPHASNAAEQEPVLGNTGHLRQLRLQARAARPSPVSRQTPSAEPSDINTAAG